MSPTKPLGRLLSLDVFRGLTIVLMILVNSPGNKVAYPWLEHSEWNGCTLADLVFPFFIVILGASLVLALSNLRKKGLTDAQLAMIVLKRSLTIFMIGLILNLLPNHFDLSQLRILGVLQRIALCYGVSALLFLKTSMRTQGVIALALLLAYWLLMGSVPSLGPLSMNNNWVGYVDTLLLSPQHLYLSEAGFDPEGLLSTLPAIASASLGNLLGFCLLSSKSKQQQFQWMLVTGLGLMLLGGLWSLVVPLNKSLWSSSYVLWTGGLAFLLYALCFALIEIKQQSSWTKPFALFGRHAMLVYVLHVFFLKIQAIIHLQTASGETLNLRLYITDALFYPLNPEAASLCYALCYTLLWLLVLTIMTKRLPRR